MRKDALPLTVGFALGLIAATAVCLIEKPEEPMDCEAIRIEEWAHLMCFAQQPACEITSYKTYVRYRQMKNAAKHCPLDEFE